LKTRSKRHRGPFRSENNIDELEANHSQAAGPEELNQQLQDLNKKISDGKKVLHDAKV
jgi:hypothetical protein